MARLYGCHRRLPFDMDRSIARILGQSLSGVNRPKAQITNVYPAEEKSRPACSRQRCAFETEPVW